MPKKTLIQCPVCRAQNEFFAEPVGPFCSSRCKLLDLGRWLAEDYKISEPLQPQHFEEFEELSGDNLDKPEGS